jgi:hypothetical protein
MAHNPMSRRARTIDDLRLAIECLPRPTRVAMLEGLAANDIIVGAYSNREGICPMLAAHRAGGRTSFIGFAEAWDRFAARSGAIKRARRASERELLILRTHLQASLLAEDAGGETLAAAIADHSDLTARGSTRRPAPARPGDRDRSQELRGAPGWAWTRVFRRYDDYERALARLALEAPAAAQHTPSPV